MQKEIHFEKGWKITIPPINILDTVLSGPVSHTFDGQIRENRLVKGKIYERDLPTALPKLLFSGSFTEDGFYQKGRLYYYDRDIKDKYKEKNYFDGRFQSNSCIPEIGLLYYKLQNTFFGEFDKDGNPYKGIRKYTNHLKYDTFDGIFDKHGNPVKGILFYRDGNIFNGSFIIDDRRIIYDVGCLYLKNPVEIQKIQGKFFKNEIQDGEVTNSLGFSRNVVKGIRRGNYYNSKLKLNDEQSQLINKFYKSQRIYSRNKEN